MKRKILNILLIGALVIGLTGCGKNSEKKDTEQKSNEQEKGEIKEDITEQKKIGDTISLDFVEVTLDKLEVKNNYKFRREEKTSYGTNIRNASIEPVYLKLMVVNIAQLLQVSTQQKPTDFSVLSLNKKWNTFYMQKYHLMLLTT